jgi:DNA processing protein
LVLSEYPPGTPARPEHFPQRNRIIAGLGRGLLVVEAGMPSGSLLSARLALESNREVMAVPGSIHSGQSRGCHALIKQGAALVESPADVLEVLGTATPPKTLEKRPPLQAEILPQEECTTAEHLLLQALGSDTLTLDLLAERTGLPIAALQAQMLELELTGQVARLPGSQFQRLHRA